MIRIYPSLISANLLNLDFEIQKLEPFVDGFHIDIMDNHFVENLTWGPDMINAIAQVTHKPLWIHLMVTDPISIIERCALTPLSLITFHLESNKKTEEVVSSIIEKNCLPGIAINPKTAPRETMSFLHNIHHVLPMSVVPGFAGQEFLPETIGVIDKLVTYKRDLDLDFLIMGDGGINKSNIKQIYMHGVTDVAIASGIFSHEDPIIAIQELRDIIK